MNKYKDFETWALKHGWFFIKQSYDFYYWLSPVGLGFTVIINDDTIEAHNSSFNCDVKVAR
jgi:hypothetical protein